MKILVCDDDDGMLCWLKSSLVTRGFDVYLALGGDEALRIYRQNLPFDYVLTDLRMPGNRIKDGMELVAAIRQLDPLQSIIMHTNEEGLEAPCPVILKPYSLEKLLRLLRKPVQPLLF